MITFEVQNELTLRVTCRGGGAIFAKAGAFIAGESLNGKNYRFEKMMLGPSNGGGLAQAAFGALKRRMAGESLPLMRVNFDGDSVTYYANAGQHVVVYHLENGEMISVESENLLAFTADCHYDVRFLGAGIFSQKGLATSTLTGNGSDAYVAVICDGNPLVLSNIQTHATLSVDPDAVICWIGDRNTSCDPAIRTDVNWKTFIGQASGESYAYEWSGAQQVTVIIQPSERKGGIRIGVD